MKRSKPDRKKQAPKAPPLAHSAENTHFRLCHFCLTLNESAEPIIQCAGCHQFLTADVELVGLNPSDDANKASQRVLEDEDESTEGEGDAAVRASIHITGLSVEW